MGYDGLEESSSAGPSCYFCGNQAEGTTYHIWTGYLISQRRIQDSSSGRLFVEGNYHNLKQIGIRVCPDCALALWRKNHLKGAVGWGVLTFLILIAAIVVPFLGMKASTLAGLLVLLGLFAILFGALWVMDMRELLSPSFRDAAHRLSRSARNRCLARMEYLVLQRVKDDFASQADSFFTNMEYRVLFLKEEPP